MRRSRRKLENTPLHARLEHLARDLGVKRSGGWRNGVDKQQKPDHLQYQTAPLFNEQLRNLLNNFLDQLIASKTPAPAGMDQPHDSKDQQPQQEGPTLEEMYQGWKEGREGEASPDDDRERQKDGAKSGRPRAGLPERR
jgi:hypothetical protein